MPPELTIHIPRSGEAGAVPVAQPDDAHPQTAATANDRPLVVGRIEFARLLDISPPTLDRLRAAGKLPRPVNLGGVKWLRAEVEVWLLTRGAGGELLDGEEWEMVRDRVMRKAVKSAL